MILGSRPTRHNHQGEGIRAKSSEDAENEVLALRAELEGLEGLALEAKFSELASVFSDDAPPLGTEQLPGALPIGHLGWFGSGQMARPFEEATAVRRTRLAFVCTL
jgi:hypothetical protein